MITPRLFGTEDVGCKQICVDAAGLCIITGLMLAGLPGELCGLGGCRQGLAAGRGFRSGLCDLGRLLITEAVPPPSNTPESASRDENLSRVGPKE